jgi:hypothetical protein
MENIMAQIPLPDYPSIYINIDYDNDTCRLQIKGIGLTTLWECIKVMPTQDIMCIWPEITEDDISEVTRYFLRGL